MRCSFRIANGRVVDPASHIDGVQDIYIRNSRIVKQPANAEADETIDATGCLVFPGLIDFHTHLDRRRSDAGMHPDLMTLPNGVTTAVDAGTAGTSTFEGFYRDVVCGAEITIKSFVNISGAGMATECYRENIDPANYDRAKLAYLFERYADQLLGIKVRVGRLFSGNLGLRPVVAIKELATELGTRICIHVVEPESPYEETFASLGAGDILCHCFQGKGAHSILDGKGKVSPAARAARERGVIFDCAHGKGNYSFNVARQALDDGFFPDVISSDVVDFSVYKPTVFSLACIMSEYLGMGLPLMEVVRATTATPARLMGLEGSVGTLAPGALADVAIFKFHEHPMTFRDQLGTSIQGKGLLIPQMTIKAGRTAYMDMKFAFCPGGRED